MEIRIYHLEIHPPPLHQTLAFLNKNEKLPTLKSHEIIHVRIFKLSQKFAIGIHYDRNQRIRKLAEQVDIKESRMRIC